MSDIGKKLNEFNNQAESFNSLVDKALSDSPDEVSPLTLAIESGLKSASVPYDQEELIDPDPVDPVDDIEWDDVPDSAWLEITRLLVQLEQIQMSLSELEGACRSSGTVSFPGVTRLRSATRRISKSVDSIIDGVPVIAVAVTRALGREGSKSCYRDMINQEIGTLRARRQLLRTRRPKS